MDLSHACQFSGAAKPHCSCTSILGRRGESAGADAGAGAGTYSTAAVGSSESGPGSWEVEGHHLEGLATAAN